jgi:hypothetical protein
MRDGGLRHWVSPVPLMLLKYRLHLACWSLNLHRNDEEGDWNWGILQ